MEGRLAQAGLRGDGRGAGDGRALGECEAGQLAHSAGSARVARGRTEALAAVKLELAEPVPGRPAACRVAVDVAEAGPRGSRAQELRLKQLGARVERLLLGPPSCPRGPLDEGNDLAVVPGETVWLFYVDLLVLHDDGSLIETLALATKLALQSTTMPKAAAVEVEGEGDLGLEAGLGGGPTEIEVDDDPASGWRLRLDHVPLVVVVGVVGGRHVVDPTAEEEAGAEATVELAINRKGNILGSQVFGPGALEPSLLRDIVEAACAAGVAYHRTFAEGLAGVGAGVGA